MFQISQCSANVKKNNLEISIAFPFYLSPSRRKTKTPYLFVWILFRCFKEHVIIWRSVFLGKPKVYTLFPPRCNSRSRHLATGRRGQMGSESDHKFLPLMLDLGCLDTRARTFCMLILAFVVTMIRFEYKNPLVWPGFVPRIFHEVKGFVQFMLNLKTLF